MSVFLKVLLAFIGGWFICFGMVRSYFKIKYAPPEIQGILKVAYDKDDPMHPAMGLEIESLNYILQNDQITLAVNKIGFPSGSDKVILESKKGKSA